MFNCVLQRSSVAATTSTKPLDLGSGAFVVNSSRSSLSVTTMREATSSTPGSPKTTRLGKPGRGYRYAVTANTLEDRNATHLPTPLATAKSGGSNPES